MFQDLAVLVQHQSESECLVSNAGLDRVETMIRLCRAVIDHIESNVEQAGHFVRKGNKALRYASMRILVCTVCFVSHEDAACAETVSNTKRSLGSGCVV